MVVLAEQDFMGFLVHYQGHAGLQVEGVLCAVQAGDLAVGGARRGGVGHLGHGASLGSHHTATRLGRHHGAGRFGRRYDAGLGFGLAHRRFAGRSGLGGLYLGGGFFALSRLAGRGYCHPQTDHNREHLQHFVKCVAIASHHLFLSSGQQTVRQYTQNEKVAQDQSLARLFSTRG